MPNQKDYMRWLRGKAGAKSLDVVTRTYKNASGADELISLSECYWGYVDWLETRGDIDFQDWVLHCEANPHEDWPISQQLMYWLWQDECARWINCQPVPSDEKPVGLRFWKATYGDRVWTAGFNSIR